VPGHLHHITARIDGDLYEALREHADEHHNGSISAAVKEILAQGLQGEQLAGLGNVGMKNRGYADGLRRGLHEARVAISNAVANLWPE
jgi:plasmid stability protein